MPNLGTYLQQRHQVTHLVHFTPLSNLEYILQDGLIPNASLDKTHFRPDPQRLDQHPERTCLSISYPNTKLLATYKHRYGQEDVEFCYLLIPATYLDEIADGDAYFYANNAAHDIPYQRRNGIPFHQNHGTAAIDDMFMERTTIGQVEFSRTENEVPTMLTTNPQAELQISTVVPPRCIFRVIAPRRALVNPLRETLNPLIRENKLNTGIVCSWKIQNTDISFFSWPRCWEPWKTNRNPRTA